MSFGGSLGECHAILRSGTAVLIRPLVHEDLPPYRDFLSHVTAEDLRLRFFASMSKVSDQVIDALVHYDPAHAMAWILMDEKTKNLLGVGRLHDDNNAESAEFAILVGSQFKDLGVGWLLMERIIDHAKRKGLKTVHGQVLSENSLMLKMCAEFDFHIDADSDQPGVIVVTLKLQGTSAAS
jgi:acetyltransferase